MKRIEIIKNSKGYALGFEEGKKEIIDKILKFVDDESKFIAGIYSDTLLDRLVKLVKNLELKQKGSDKSVNLH